MRRLNGFTTRFRHRLRRRFASIGQPMLLDDAQRRFNAEHSGGS